MPLMDQFRLPRFGREAAPPPPEEDHAPSRLDRMLARQKVVRLPTEVERALQALEEECSPPLYEASVYRSEPQGSEED